LNYSPLELQTLNPKPNSTANTEVNRLSSSTLDPSNAQASDDNVSGQVPRG